MDEREFTDMMEIVDAHLRQSGIPEHARPIRGWMIVSSSLGQSLKLAGQKDRPQDGVYTGDSLSARIMEWFETRYADKLKIRFGPGRIVAIIRDDPWEIHLPKVWGSVRFVVSREKTSTGRPQLSTSGPVVVNILDLIEKLPHGLRNTLAHDEMNAVGARFLAGYAAMSALDSLRKCPLVAQAINDFDVAVHCIVGAKNYGNARWSALQACEKCLKAYIDIRGGRVQHHHRLCDLAADASALGLTGIDERSLRRVQVSASVRYGSGASTLSDTYTGYCASLDISRRIAETISATQSP
jgi:hypothetical protein